MRATETSFYDSAVWQWPEFPVNAHHWSSLFPHSYTIVYSLVHMFRSIIAWTVRGFEVFLIPISFSCLGFHGTNLWTLCSFQLFIICGQILLWDQWYITVSFLVLVYLIFSPWHSWFKFIEANTWQINWPLQDISGFLPCKRKWQDRKTGILWHASLDFYYYKGK